MKIKYMGIAGSFALLSLVAIAAGISGATISKALIGPGFVAFDTVKYMSARRDMTIRLLGSDAELKQEAVSVLARVEKNTMAVIDKLANGRTVIVKQAMVVDGQVDDITDDVLAELGLPTTAVTIAPQSPDRILTPYSISEDYAQAEKEHEAWEAQESARKAEVINRQREVIADQERREVERFIP